MYDERIIPDKTPVGIYSIHLKRYEFAKTYMKGKLILDVACGVGYGARYLSDAGNRVIGVEIDSDQLHMRKSVTPVQANHYLYNQMLLF